MMNMQHNNVKVWVEEAKKAFSAADYESLKDLYNALACDYYLKNTEESFDELNDFDCIAWSDAMQEADVVGVWQSVEDVDSAAYESVMALLDQEK